MLALTADAGSSSAPLVVSIVALALSASVAAWNVLKYVLDGGRVRVRLDRGYLSDRALHTRPFRSKWMIAGLDVPSEYHVEVGVLRVENLGRTAVTIYEAGFDIDWRWSWRRLRIWRWTVQPAYYRFKDSKTESVLRIDPFDFALFLLDVEPALQSPGYKQPWRRKKVIRGSVGVAGKRLRRRSSVFRSWRVDLDAKWLRGPESVGQAAYRSLFRAENRQEGDGSPSVVSATYAAHKIQQAVDAGEVMTVDSLKGLLKPLAGPDDDEDGSYRVSMLAINLYYDLVTRGLIEDAKRSNQTLLTSPKLPTPLVVSHPRPPCPRQVRP